MLFLYCSKYYSENEFYEGTDMAVKVDHPVFDGTTGRGDHSGRRTHIIKLLRDSKEPLTVEQVAKRVGLPPNAVRFHLESLVDAGLAVREAQARTTPGRPRVAYMGTLPNQTHEREQGFRLLAERMSAAIAQKNENAGEWMYQVGLEWGRQISCRPDPEGEVDEAEVIKALAEKLDAMWFAPEVVGKDAPRLILHNCPFSDSSRRYPQVICQLHAGMINGSLEEMGSKCRMTRLRPQAPGHKCEGELVRTTTRMAKVLLEPRSKSS